MAGHVQRDVLDLRGDIQLPLELPTRVKNFLASMALCIHKHFPYKKTGTVLWTPENIESIADLRTGWPAFLYVQDIQELIGLGYLEINKEDGALYLTDTGQSEGERILTDFV